MDSFSKIEEQQQQEGSEAPSQPSLIPLLPSLAPSATYIIGSGDAPRPHEELTLPALLLPPTSTSSSIPPRSIVPRQRQMTPPRVEPSSSATITAPVAPTLIAAPPTQAAAAYSATGSNRSTPDPMPLKKQRPLHHKKSARSEAVLLVAPSYPPILGADPTTILPRGAVLPPIPRSSSFPAPFPDVTAAPLPSLARTFSFESSSASSLASNGFSTSGHPSAVKRQQLRIQIPRSASEDLVSDLLRRAQQQQQQQQYYQPSPEPTSADSLGGSVQGPTMMAAAPLRQPMAMLGNVSSAAASRTLKPSGGKIRLSPLPGRSEPSSLSDQSQGDAGEEENDPSVARLSMLAKSMTETKSKKKPVRKPAALAPLPAISPLTAKLTSSLAFQPPV